MTNSLFKLVFRNEIKSSSEKQNLVEEFYIAQHRNKKDSERKFNNVYGGHYLSEPGMYVYYGVGNPSSELFLLQYQFPIEYVTNRFILFLQETASCLLQEEFGQPRTVSVDDTETNQFLTISVSYVNNGDSFSSSYVIVAVDAPTRSMNTLGVKPEFIDHEPFEVRLHLYVFISQVLRITENFKQIVMQHDSKVLKNFKSHPDDFVNVPGHPTVEEMVDFGDRFFSNRLTKEELEKVQFRWYDLEQLFTDHLKKEALAMKDVEQIIRDEEEKWREGEPREAVSG